MIRSRDGNVPALDLELEPFLVAPAVHRLGAIDRFLAGAQFLERHAPHPQSSTCEVPNRKIECRSRHNRAGASSSPTTNSSGTIPSSAIPIYHSASPTRPSTCGPITAPATR